MKSHDGQYFPNLDHIRGLAAFLVFGWHFIHALIPPNIEPQFFALSLIDEGHSGVSLFMVLSGYLFTKLLSGRSIIISRFFFNRILRLAPLLIMVLLVHGFIWVRDGKNLSNYVGQLFLGLVAPTWPGGAWSIAVELHFYLLLPVLLWVLRRWPTALLAIVAAAVLFRVAWWATHDSVQALSYYTIIGRIDQFLFGMLASQFSARLKKRHLLALGTALTFFVIYYWFDLAGGFEKMPSYPSPSWIWVFLPTLEGLCFAILIGYYDTSFVFKKTVYSKAISVVGTVSYSIYLLHVFLIATLTRYVHYFYPNIVTFEAALFAAIVAFVPTVLIAWVSYKTIEAPFLRLRVQYLSPVQRTAPA